MAASLADLLQYRERLEAACFSDTRRVRDANGEEVEYRSQRELMRALTALNRQIAHYGGVSRIVRFRSSKGL